MLALACVAGAYYGGRALQIREARRMWGSIATPEVKREMELMNAIIKQMSREDRQYVAGLGSADFDEGPLQLELFTEYHEQGYSPSE